MILKKIIFYYIKQLLWHGTSAIIRALGLVWVIVNSAVSLNIDLVRPSYCTFAITALIIAIAILAIDGFFVGCYFRKSVTIAANNCDTKIKITFDDFFCQSGWKAISVNDFFDSVVDDHHIAKNSLHGQMLIRYFGGNIAEWDVMVDNDLKNVKFEIEHRDSGKQQRFAIGTTATIKKDNQRFLCVVLTKTNLKTLEVKAFAQDLIQAVRGLLQKGRSVCANEPLNIPLMGSGLSRVGLKSNTLVDLILTAIFEEIKHNKVTNEINIILPYNKINDINLKTIKDDWS